MKLTLKGTVIKMKNICRSTIAIILAFVCIISFAGCVKDGGAKPGDGTTEAEPATKQDPKLAAIEKIKKEAVELVNDDSDDKDSADELFAVIMSLTISNRRTGSGASSERAMPHLRNTPMAAVFMLLPATELFIMLRAAKENTASAMLSSREAAMNICHRCFLTSAWI